MDEVEATAPVATEKKTWFYDLYAYPLVVDGQFLCVHYKRDPELALMCLYARPPSYRYN